MQSCGMVDPKTIPPTRKRTEEDRKRNPEAWARRNAHKLAYSRRPETRARVRRRQQEATVLRRLARWGTACPDEAAKLRAVETARRNAEKRLRREAERQTDPDWAAKQEAERIRKRVIDQRRRDLRKANPVKHEVWREKHREQQKKWLARHPEVVKDYRKRTLFKVRARRFGMTEEGLRELYQKQDGRCALCGRHGTLHKSTDDPHGCLVVDHCHRKKKVRGMLCHWCNIILGHHETNGWDPVAFAIRFRNYLKAK